MVEGLTFFSTVQGSAAGPGSPGRLGEIEVLQSAPRAGPFGLSRRVAADPQSTQKILVTLAERPHPFPSRTRKLSSPAPKILRGQPFGKIGRRQDFCVSERTRRATRDGLVGWRVPRPAYYLLRCAAQRPQSLAQSLYPVRDDTARSPHLPSGWLSPRSSRQRRPLPRGRRLASRLPRRTRRRDPRPPSSPRSVHSSSPPTERGDRRRPRAIIAAARSSRRGG